MIKPLLHEDPQHIGTYRLVARLGSGGMGTVYLARSPGGRTVAVKTVHAHIAADAAFRTRFRLETDAARIIGGRYGAQVIGADPLAGTPWLATEYVLGPPLDEAVSLCGPLPEPSVRALGAALCGALGQLHGSDVVHRDLKPSNIMITAYGPKVIDFGIARAIGDDRLTRVGAAAGTPAFMSPEQASDREHTSAGDVFALAGVLVFAASGHGPFGGGQPADLLYRVRYADPDLTGVPAALAPLLARCLTKDPPLRPTTRELAAALHDGHGQFADHLPPVLLAEIARRATEVWQFRPERLPATPPEQSVTGSGASAPGHKTGMSRRKLLSLAGLATAGVAGAGLWFRPGLSEAKDAKTPSAAGSGPAASPTARDVEGPWRIVWTTDPSMADDTLPPLFAGRTVMVDYGGHLRGLDPADGTHLWTYSTTSSGSWAVADGSRLYGIVGSTEKEHVLVSVDPTTGLKARSLADQSDFKLPSSGGSADLLHASGGSIYLAAGSDTPNEYDWHLHAVDSSSGKVRWRVPLKEVKKGDGYSRGFAKVIGNRLILGEAPHDLLLTAFDTRSGKVLWQSTLPGWASASSTPVTTGEQLASDGSQVYLGSRTLQAVSLATGVAIWEFGRDRYFERYENSYNHYGPPAVRDGVVYATEKGRGIVAVDAKRGELLWEVPVPDGNASTRAAPPVLGRTRLYYGEASGLGLIDLSTRKYVRSLKTPIRSFALATDKRTLVGSAQDGTVEALRLDE
ncbi:PQQ-binding-like beta-propeller repeat protein [Streptomyces sp. NPDC014735]|uniref:protein kinase domain-containing protein n=1 Tax=unclassified Streptomyces TaxID=2593676 RepID=UPI0036F8F633